MGELGRKTKGRRWAGFSLARRRGIASDLWQTPAKKRMTGQAVDHPRDLGGSASGSPAGSPSLVQRFCPQAPAHATLALGSRPRPPGGHCAPCAKARTRIVRGRATWQDRGTFARTVEHPGNGRSLSRMPVEEWISTSVGLEVAGPSRRAHRLLPGRGNRRDQAPPSLARTNGCPAEGDLSGGAAPRGGGRCVTRTGPLFPHPRMAKPECPAGPRLCSIFDFIWFLAVGGGTQLS